jgi:uncharacterized protein YjiS (DUF1127 family)
MLGRACPLALWRQFRRWRRHRHAIAALQALDARMLKDIGITRSEITSVVSGLGRDASRRTTTAAPKASAALPASTGDTTA